VNFEFDREHTERIAKEAVLRMKALDLPFDPPNFEFWFTYCSGSNRDLNAAVNGLLKARPIPSRKELRALHALHVSKKSYAEEVRTIGEDLREQASEVAGAIEEASDTAGEFSGELANAVRDVEHAESKEALGLTVASLLQSTADIQRTNAQLQAQLSASADQVRQLQERLEAVQLESSLDTLTGATNRRFFDDSLVRLIAQAETLGDPISLLLIDVDNFKLFNDRYGHIVGDDVLRLVASVIKQVSRFGDVVCRYGGDEFAVILPRTAVENAFEIAERIRSGITEKELLRRSTREKLGHLTVSIGVSQHQHGKTPESLVERADEWLYAAKEGGRNRVGLDPSWRIDTQADGGSRPSYGLIWQKAYECGAPIIDRGHRDLFELANTLFDPALTEASRPQVYRTQLDNLLAHVVQHFADEEAELAVHGYIELNEHKAAHAKLIADAHHFKAEVGLGNRTLADLREFIVNEVVAEHMFKVDREFFSLFRPGANFSR
jgi:diguanylate cyclase (GGDEF)-like protein/hemerythrin-like metal-binding protein